MIPGSIPDDEVRAKLHRLHATILEDVKATADIDIFERNTTGDGMVEKAKAFLSKEKQIRDKLGGPSIKREKFQASYWHRWNDNKNVLEGISAKEAAIQKNSDPALVKRRRQKEAHRRMQATFAATQREFRAHRVISHAFAAPDTQKVLQELERPAVGSIVPVDHDKEFVTYVFEKSLLKPAASQKQSAAATASISKVNTESTETMQIAMVDTIDNSKALIVTDGAKDEVSIRPRPVSAPQTSLRTLKATNTLKKSQSSRRPLTPLATTVCKGGAMSMAPRRLGAPGNLDTAGCDIPPLPSALSKALEPSSVSNTFGSANRFSDPVKLEGTAPSPIPTAAINSSTAGHVFSLAPRFATAPSSTSPTGGHKKGEAIIDAMPGPAHYTVPRLFDTANQTTTGTSLTANYETTDLLKERQNLMQRVHFGFACDIQDHVRFGLCGVPGTFSAALFHAQPLQAIRDRDRDHRSGGDRASDHAQTTTTNVRNNANSAQVNSGGSVMSVAGSSVADGLSMGLCDAQDMCTVHATASMHTHGSLFDGTANARHHKSEHNKGITVMPSQCHCCHRTHYDSRRLRARHLLQERNMRLTQEAAAEAERLRLAQEEDDRLLGRGRFAPKSSKKPNPNGDAGEDEHKRIVAETNDNVSIGSTSSAGRIAAGGSVSSEKSSSQYSKPSMNSTASAPVATGRDLTQYYTKRKKRELHQQQLRHQAAITKIIEEDTFLQAIDQLELIKAPAYELTALMAAALREDIVAIRTMARAMVNPNVTQPETKRTALHHAAQANKPRSVQAILTYFSPDYQAQYRENRCDDLNRHPLQVNARDFHHDTALHLACRGGFVEVVQLLCADSRCRPARPVVVSQLSRADWLRYIVSGGKDVAQPTDSGERDENAKDSPSRKRKEEQRRRRKAKEDQEKALKAKADEEENRRNDAGEYETEICFACPNREDGHRMWQAVTAALRRKEEQSGVISQPASAFPQFPVA